MLRGNLSSHSISRFIDHLRNPLYRNGYALVLNSAVTSGLGMAYWILAARYYSPETIGLNSAVLSTVMFLSSIAQFNLVNTLNRFVPSAGRATHRLILYAYGVSLTLGVILSMIFVFGIDTWAPALSFLKQDPTFTLLFILSVELWCVFALQDSILIGTRQATWVLIENSIFSVAKLALLVYFASVIADYGVWASWVVPIAGGVVFINMLLFSRIIPQHVRATQDRAVPIGRKQIAMYVSGDYIGSIIWIATIDLLPLIVIERVSTTANAYFYLSWTISYSLYLVSRNMGMSLTTEAALDQKKLYLYSYQTLVQTFRLLVPIVLLMVIGAPYLLTLLGKDYAAEATTLLRLLSLAALPSVVTSLYISIARVQRRVASIILIQGILCVFVLGLSFILLETHGILGVGIAWLGSQTVLAVFLLLTYLRPIWMANVDIQILLQQVTRLRHAMWHWNRRTEINEALALVPQVLPSIPASGELIPSAWNKHTLLRTLSDVIVIALSHNEEQPAALLKLARTDAAVASLKRQQTVVSQLQQIPQLEDWRVLLPNTLLTGETTGHFYVVEQALPGVEAKSLFEDAAIRNQLLNIAANTITQLHTATATTVTTNDALLNRWIHQPLQLVRNLTSNHRDAKESREILDRLSDELLTALENKNLTVSWIHGDYWLGNILVTPEADAVSGILDWDNASKADLPLFDIMQLLISSRTLLYKRDLNYILREILEGGGWTEHESSMIDRSLGALPDDRIEMRVMVILSWLNHITANLTKAELYQKHSFWITKNIHGVLNWL